MKNNTIMKMQHGSKLYGTNTADSDADFKSIYLPSLDDFLLQRVKKTIDRSTGSNQQKNTKEDIDDQSFSLPYFLELCLQGQTVALDMLHAPLDWEEVSSPIWEDLKSKRAMFYTKDMKSFVGYCKQQSHRYGVKGSRLDAVSKIITWCNQVLSENKVTETTTFKDYLSLVGYKGDLNTQEVPSLAASFAEAKRTGKASPKGLKIFKGIETFPIVEHTTKVEDGQYLEDGSQFIRDNAKSYIKILEKTFSYTSYVEDLLKALTQHLDSYGSRAVLAKENKGIDYKAVSHAFRAGLQLKEILETGDLKYPLKDRDFLLRVKQGKLHWVEDKVSERLETLIEEIDYLTKQSSLPSEPDRGYWEGWLLDALKTNLDF